MIKTAEQIITANQRLRKVTFKLGDILVNGFHLLALFAIGATIVWAATYEFLHIVSKGHASVEDVLLLFIYLELGAMVGIYFTTNRMPVRFLVYVALTALTRLLIGMANLEHVDMMAAIQTPHYGLLLITSCILLLAFAVLILRYASFKYPSLPPLLTEITDPNAVDEKAK